MLSVSAARYLPDRSDDLDKNIKLRERPQRDFKETLSSKEEIEHRKLLQSEITVSKIVSLAG